MNQDKPFNITQKALWELYFYNKWSIKDLATLNARSENTILEELTQIRKDFNVELIRIHNEKIKAIKLDSTLFYTTPLTNTLQ